MSYRIDTICAKDPKDPRTTKPHQLPIYATSSFEFESIEEGMDVFTDPSKGHIYARFANPTVDAVGSKIAQLEAYETDCPAPWGIMTSSGMSAILTVVMAEAKAGDKILTQGNLYGGTTELFKKVLSKYDIEPILVNLKDSEEITQALEKHPDIRLIYFETPSNPALDCIDIAAVAQIARGAGVRTIVDNTFCTPYLQQPLAHGIDYVIHSTTKYINGHGNSISGVMIGRDQTSQQRVWSTMKLLGTNSNPWDAWLANNGMKTLPLRMRQHSANGLALSKYLKDHPKVAAVRYLGLESHPDHELASRQMRSYGGMMCFEVVGGYEGGLRFMNAIQIGALAPTMGNIDTLILHPASMSHLNVDPAIRLENGITDSLIRVSVGIEDIQDLQEDFNRALAAV
ncbi:MAG: aminotransferase class I/II-fold pyridoxal phosphate-dependent enzyme [Bacteroidota bacterium]